MNFWDTPAGREGLAARHTERLVLNQARTACGPDCSCHGRRGRRGSTVEEIVLDTRYHDGEDGCGYAWAFHNYSQRGSRLPFGCPTEAEARECSGAQ